MKKSKFVLLSLVLIVLLSFSLFFIPVGVKAASDEEEIQQLWEEAGLPLSALNYMEFYPRGIEFYLYLYLDFEPDYPDKFITLKAVKTYEFDDGIITTDANYLVKIVPLLFDDYLISVINYYVDTYGKSVVIPQWETIVIYWNVIRKKFVAPDYLNYWVDKSYNNYNLGFNHGRIAGYNEGYNEGQEAGYGLGYETGLEEGYNIGYDEGYDIGFEVAQPKMDILLITLIMFIVSVFVYFKFRLRWVLIATTLLWFVPIFLVENLFIKIFSVIMIVATIVITFFNDREEDLE